MAWNRAALRLHHPGTRIETTSCCSDSNLLAAAERQLVELRGEGKRHGACCCHRSRSPTSPGWLSGSYPSHHSSGNRSMASSLLACCACRAAIPGRPLPPQLNSAFSAAETYDSYLVWAPSMHASWYTRPLHPTRHLRLLPRQLAHPPALLAFLKKRCMCCTKVKWRSI